MMRTQPSLLLASTLAVVSTVTPSAQNQEGLSFRSGVELINVTATVTDDDGRFASRLRKEDFTVFEDGIRQEITYFSNDRVPVSLGILLDASGSMTRDKMSAARSAIDRFIYHLLGRDDELFFLEFANRPNLVQEWTTDRRVISRAVVRVTPAGGTALYDAIVRALPLASVDRHPKKASWSFPTEMIPTAACQSGNCGHSSERPRYWCTRLAWTAQRSPFDLARGSSFLFRCRFHFQAWLPAVPSRLLSEEVGGA